MKEFKFQVPMWFKQPQSSHIWGYDRIMKHDNPTGVALSEGFVIHNPHGSLWMQYFHSSSSVCRVSSKPQTSLGWITVIFVPQHRHIQCVPQMLSEGKKCYKRKSQIIWLSWNMKILCSDICRRQVFVPREEKPLLIQGIRTPRCTPQTNGPLAPISELGLEI